MSSFSNTDSQGCPIDHDGHCLEDGGFSSSAPIAISGLVFEELFAGSGKDLGCSHLEAQASDENRTFVSSSGGIPVIERVEIEDVEDGYSSDEPPSPRTAREMCKNDTSSTIQAVLRTSQHERDALYATRRKLGDVLAFLRKNGFSEEQVLADRHSHGEGPKLLDRDENGLPTRSSPAVAIAPNPFKEKLKGKIDDAPPIPPADEVLEEKTVSIEEKKKSWSQVLNDSIPKSPPLKLDFIQSSVGSSKISPPVEVLKMGNENFKHCLIGTFSKGSLPFAKVLDFARKVWEHKGLVHVSQKDSHTYLFRFKEVNDINSVLARGTWFVERRPLIVHAWGTNICHKTHIPLWIKFEKVPDCYWTKDGLSWLASSIGSPLCADENTSKLEVLPYAKLCVNYKIGDDLPSNLAVEVLDPVTEAISIENVLVSYPVKPMVCTACKSLGHLVGACPKVTRQWVRKENTDSKGLDAQDKSNADVVVEDVSAEKDVVVEDVSAEKNVSDSTKKSRTAVPSNGEIAPGPHVETDSGGWQEVKRKSSSPQTVPGVNNAPSSKATAASSLPIYNALSRTLSKSQRKRAKKSGGNHSPPKH